MINHPYIENLSNKFYHYSDFLFKKPDIELIYKNRKNHINGLLGLYFSTTQCDWGKGFGKYAYEIVIPESFNKEIISLNDFYKLTSLNLMNLNKEQEIEYFKSLRKYYLNKNIDFLLVLENNNSCGMGVLINLGLEINLIIDNFFD